MPLFFDSSGQRGEQGASEARKRPSGAFVARCACRGVITPRASLVARSKKRGHNVCCDLFFGFRQEIKMLGRSEFTLRQVFAAQNACTAQKRRFFDSSGQRGEQGASEARKRPSGAFVARCACRGVITPRASLVARSKKRGHNVCCDLFFGFRQEIKMLGRSEFTLRQGFAAQNACTAQKRRFFGFRQEIKMLGRSEFALRQGFAAQNACTAQKRCFLLR